MPAIAAHPQRNTIRLELRNNLILKQMPLAAWDELEPLLEVADYRKGDLLVHQGSHEMEQLFILDGILKAVVANPEGKEMIFDSRPRPTWTRRTPPGASRHPCPTRSSPSPRCARRSSHGPVGRVPGSTPGREDALRIRGHAAHERGDGAYDHAASPRRTRAARALHAQARRIAGRLPNKELASYLNSRRRRSRA